MKRLLLYVHFNKYNNFSKHVHYQLEQMRPLFSKVVFISNSNFPISIVDELTEKGLIHHFIQRENAGYDFAAWRDGMDYVGFDNIQTYDSITCMNDTCFGPLWDIKEYYEYYENDVSVSFWGMTNHKAVDAGHVYIDEHLQRSYVYEKTAKSPSAVTDRQH